MLVFAALILLLASPAWATTRYVDGSLGANCSGDYSVSARACTGSDGDAYTTANVSSAFTATVAGDTLYFRAGTYDISLPVFSTSLTGTASSRVTIAGYPSETVIFRPTTSHLVATGSVNKYITFKNFKLDGVNTVGEKSFSILNATGLTFEDIEIYDTQYLGFSVGGVQGVTTFRRVYIHDGRSDCAVGNRYYGAYLHDGDQLVFEDSEIYNMPGGGLQIYTGPWNAVTVRNNSIHHNSWCTSTTVGGIIVSAAQGLIQNIEIYNNAIWRQAFSGGGTGNGIELATPGNTYPINGAKLYNNVIWDNDGSSSYGIVLQDSGVQNTDIKNNIITDNKNGSLANEGTSTSLTYNACKAAESCGTTGKVSLADITSVLVDPANGDFRLKQGANALRDVGTSVSTRSTPVGVTDIGAYEQGAVSSAVVSGAFIEVTVNVGTTPILPSTGITQFTIANGTSTGTPVVTQAVRKSGSSNVVQLSVSGFTASGTCTISYGAGNLTDSGFVGLPSDELAQGVNSASGVSVSGTCANTSGDPTPPSSGLYSEFLLDEGAGTTANDNSGNLNHGTVSAGVTWVDDSSGTGVTIPSDTTYRHIASTHGQAVDLTANSLSACVTVLPDTQYAQKVVLSSGGNGTNQRFYVGWYTVNGAAHWGLGVQGSGMTTVTEFPLVAEKTLVCIRANAATNTVTLSVGRSIGTSAGAVKTYSTSLILVDNMRAGNDGTNTINTGGMTIYEMWVWNNTYVSDADVQALYDSIFSAGGSVGGYKQQDFQAQRVYLDGSSDPINYGSAGASSIEVIAGGAVALVMQVDCTGGACGPLAMQWVYSKNGGAYEHGIPLQFTADGIAMWGSSTDASLNRFTVADCVSGALTENYGPTQLVAGATPTIELAQNHSYCIRAIVKFQSDQAGNYFQIRLGQDNGAELSGGYTATPRIDVVAPRASGGY